MKHFSQGLYDPPIELIEAVEERHDFQESVLQQTKIRMFSTDIQDLGKYQSLVFICYVNHLHS